MMAAIMTMMVAAGLQTELGKAAGPRLHVVPVCVESGVIAEEAPAKGLAARMLLAADVRLEWHRGLRQSVCPEGAIQITIAAHADPGMPAGAMAYARPYEGTHIRIFHDRVRSLAQGQAGRVLAHVMAHEITHILQGMCRHSPTGVMKAHWGGLDYAAMACRPLPFTAADITLIRTGLRAREARTRPVSRETRCDSIEPQQRIRS